MSNKKGIIGTITEGFAESTRNVHTINKEYMAEVKADSRAIYEQAKTPDPGMVKFKEAKGFENKVKAIGENIKDGAAQASENQKAFRAEVQSGEQYRAVLANTRGFQQSMIPNSAAMFNPYFNR